MAAMDTETSQLLRRLLLKERTAHLGTLRNGAPMVSMTLYLPERDFSAFYVHVSRLAWHTQDMTHDPRVALSISEADDRRADPFTLMRVTIRGEAAQISGGPKDAWLARWEGRETGGVRAAVLLGKHENYLTDLKFSPDGRLLATCDEAGVFGGRLRQHVGEGEHQREDAQRAAPGVVDQVVLGFSPAGGDGPRDAYLVPGDNQMSWRTQRTDGRWILIAERRVSGRGTVAVFSDPPCALAEDRHGFTRRERNGTNVGG